MLLTYVPHLFLTMSLLKQRTSSSSKELLKLWDLNHIHDHPFHLPVRLEPAFYKLVLQWNQELTLPKFSMIHLDPKPSCCNSVSGTCLYLVAWVCLTLG